MNIKNIKRDDAIDILSWIVATILGVNSIHNSKTEKIPDLMISYPIMTDSGVQYVGISDFILYSASVAIMLIVCVRFIIRSRARGQ